MTRQHIWVKHTITPVHVIEEAGEMTVFVDPDQQAVAEDSAVYGCSVCHQPMVSPHTDNECEGPDGE